MTRNLYLGADLTHVVASETVADIPARVGDVLMRVRASNPSDRMNLVADEIAAARPDVVGVQEAAVFTVQTPSDFDFDAPVINAGDPAAPGTVENLDFLALLQAALMARGAAYQVAVVGIYNDVEMPAESPAGLVDVRLVDRNAILVRADIPVASSTARVFVSRLPQFPIGGGTSKVRIDVARGWESVGLTIGLARITVVNTHLEAGGGTDVDPAVATFLNGLQQSQAGDLARVLGDLPSPVILLGDFNSAADGSGTNSYATIVKSGFTDAFAEVGDGEGGHTCCSPLDAAAFVASRRVDAVFYRGRVRADAVAVTGIAADRRTPQGLFASDHAGVYASLSVENNLP